ncbi:MAG: hypothetical protein WBV82_33545 [Myxococcaceae bacterium]
MRKNSMLLAVAVIAACGAPSVSVPVDVPHSDAGTADAGELDAGELDAGVVDAGGADAGEVDAGTILADFTLEGSRLGDVGAVGKRIRAIVERESDGARVGALDEPISAGYETFRIAGIIALGESYTVRWYIDLDDDSQCDPPPPVGDDFGFQRTGLYGTESGLEVFFHTGWMLEDVCSNFP